jgi:valyl-tRNA synthetase
VFIVVATTRPETMLGDTAVAVHPDDERYSHLVGRQVRLPLTGRLIPIVADDYADPEKGTGAVKITPAHDFNDFQLGKRHDLEVINVFTPEAKLNDDVPEEYRGLDRFVARKRIVADLDALGLLDGVDDNKMTVPYDEKSKLVVIEPFLTDQWYVDAHTLAQPAIAAVERGETVFTPRNWEKTYFNWLRNIEPWCISRQLWWGHRIPVWYGPDEHPFVAEDAAEAAALARDHYGRDEPLRQDEDVLDTWFSSALWPFSTLGWPEETDDLRRFYPTDTLVTGFDIIFFWVARMMMMGLHFTGRAPFRRVVINALVRDADGAKMSKTKGNVMDPLELVDDYGADALRFTLVAMSGQGRDLRLSRPRLEGYRNLGTKLWNAARFCQMNGCAPVAGFDPGAATSTLNRWIRGETLEVTRAVTQALERCAFDEAAGALYRFIWNLFCDWYVEFAKPVLQGEDEAAAAETRAVAAWTLDVILRLLHPISPFITEALWEQTAPAEGRTNLLIVERWPDPPAEWAAPEAAAEIGLVIAAVTEGRSLRAELNVPPGARPDLIVVEADEVQRGTIQSNAAVITHTLRIGDLIHADALPRGAVPFVVSGVTFALGVGAHIDLPAERVRLAKEIAARAADIDKTTRKLGNPDFVSRAPVDVVEENRERLAQAEAARSRLALVLERLEALA